MEQVSVVRMTKEKIKWYELFNMIGDSDCDDDEVDVIKLPNMIAWQLEEAGWVE